MGIKIFNLKKKTISDSSFAPETVTNATYTASIKICDKMESYAYHGKCTYRRDCRATQ